MGRPVDLTANAIPISTTYGGRPHVRKKIAEPEYLAPEVRAPEATLKRLEAAARLVNSDSAYSSELGFMKLRGDITAREFTAIADFLEARQAYLSAIDGKELRTANLEPRSPGTPPDPYSDVGARKAKRENRDVSTYRALELAGQEAGRGNWLMFCDTVLDGAAFTSSAKVAIKKVGVKLSDYFSLRSRNRRGNRA